MLIIVRVRAHMALVSSIAARGQLGPLTIDLLADAACRVGNRTDAHAVPQLHFTTEGA